MIFAILFEDDELHADKRSMLMSEHLKFLLTNSSKIQAAGPLTLAVNNSPTGGLWLVKAKNIDEVQYLIEEDPFWPTGLRKSIKVLEWRQVFANGKILI